MDEQGFSLESLKGAKLDGYLIFTDATETCGDEDGVVVITNQTKPGVDIMLMNAGFNFTRDGNLPGMYWMRRSEKENLRYYPVRDKKGVHAGAFPEIVSGMKTRIDFFCHERGNAAYDVVGTLLKHGYRVVLFSPHSLIIEKWFLAEPADGGTVAIKEVERVASA